MTKVTSLELSRRLKEAGVNQDSEKIYITRLIKLGEATFLVKTDEGRGGFNPVAAFDCAELLERLPQRIEHERRNHRLTLLRFSDAWYAQYRIDHSDICYFAEDTPVEALGKLYLWCLKNGHCDA